MSVDPNSPHAQLTKRQQEVLDRLEQGMGAKEIARDIGISRNAVYQHIERLRRQGALAESYTPSGQPPRRRRRRHASRWRRPSPPRESALARLRELARGGGTEAEYAEADRRRDRLRRRRRARVRARPSRRHRRRRACPATWSPRRCVGCRVLPPGEAP